MVDTPIQPLIPVPRTGDVTRKKKSDRKPRQGERRKSPRQDKDQKKGIIDTYA